MDKFKNNSLNLERLFIKALNHIKGFNWGLYLSIFLTFIIPTVYNTVKINFLGEMPDASGIGIASQFAWLDILYEVIEEGLILPLFFLMGMNLNNKNIFTNKLKTGLIVTFSIYSIISILFFINIETVARFMEVPQDIFNSSISYIRLEIIALVFSVLYLFLKVVIVLIGKGKYVLNLVIAQLIIGVLIDSILFGSFSFSVGLGVNGVAISRLVQRLTLSLICLFLIKREGIVILNNSKKMNFSWLKDWGKIGGISGLESFVRNFVFAVVILRMMNIVEQQGNFWVMMSFMWGWLLSPVLALGEVVKRNVGVNNKSHKRELVRGFILVSLIVVVWIITIPIWKFFLREVLNLQDYELVYRLSIISLIFYIIKSYNHVLDSIFYGLGRTDLMLFQSLGTNIVFYGAAYVLYLNGVWIPSIESITILFGLGMMFDSILTFVIYAYLRVKNRLLPMKLEKPEH